MDAAPLRKLVAQVAESATLDPLAAWAQQAAGSTVGTGPARSVLSGEKMLGHPLHPVLTDLPIGFWTSAFVLDLTLGQRAARSSRALIGTGVVCALPTIASGWSDFTAIDDQPTKRIGVAHAAANAVATAGYAWSWWLRRRHRRVGVAVSFGAAAVATVGGLLGGTLAFGLPDEETAKSGLPEGTPG